MAFRGAAKIAGARLLSARLAALGLAARTFGKDPQLQKMLVQRMKQRFNKRGPTAKKSPDGTPWAPLTSSGRWHTLRGNTDRRDVLKDSKTLREAITVTRQNLGPAVVNTGSGFRIGVEGPAAKYAGVHQKGGHSNLSGGRIPARPFLGVGKEDIKAVEKLAFAKFASTLESI